MSLPPANPALFARLKSATAEQHQVLEDQIDPMRRFGDPQAYREYLGRALPLYRMLESELSRLNWASLGIDFAARRKCSWLEADLASLHVSPVGETPAPLPIPNLDFGVGCLYVLEGATLGGQVINRSLQKHGIIPENGGAFFQGYGARTGEMWKSFQQAATAGVQTAEQTRSAIQGARAVFTLFTDWMSPCCTLPS